VLFNSASFIGFFAAVCALYWALVRFRRAQNALLLVASYVFYGAWDWRFLGLIALSTVVDYACGRGIERSGDAGRRRLLVVSVATNLGILATFKYFDFFAASLQGLAGSLGFGLDAVTLDVVLPVGISFYTFQTLSYTIDVYRGRLPAARDPLDFALFVAFFPQLVAGPIERAGRLLPQLARPRRFSAERLHSGLTLMTWGFFKKVVVADNAGRIADTVFGHAEAFQGLDLVLGVLAFSVQIYGDFSGYSDIARGTAKLLGFDLSVNFRLPYFSRSPREFWRRWHVSLSQWLRDYLFVPLGGSRGGRWQTARNLAITMLLGGLWHGAAWTFVAWGAYHAALLVLFRAIPDRSGPSQPLVAAAEGLGTFALVCVGWAIFRAESFDQLVYIGSHVGLATSGLTGRFAWDLLFFAMPLLLVEGWQQRTRDLLAPLRAPLPTQVAFHGFLLTWIVVFGSREPVEFIYFQF
jgi:D-alanyl-lipoteichoic acid acyltransferase DltB (MBOAT superfamily)